MKKANYDNMLKDKKVIIFDLDGTLIDSVNMLNEIYATLVKNFFDKIVSANQIQDDWDEFIHANSEAEVLSDGFLLFLKNKYSHDKEIDLRELKEQYKNIESDYIVNKIEYKAYAKETISLLKEKGYNSVNQLSGYLISNDPAYISSHKNARSVIQTVERYEIIEELVRYYLEQK